MAFARNQFCRLYFGKDRKCLNEQETKEYYRLAKKLSRAENEASYQRGLEYSKEYYKKHKDRILKQHKEWRKQCALKKEKIGIIV